MVYRSEMNKREFIKYGGLVVGTLMTGTTGAVANEVICKPSIKRKKAKLVLRFKPYELQLKHVFTICIKFEDYNTGCVD